MKKVIKLKHENEFLAMQQRASLFLDDPEAGKIEQNLQMRRQKTLIAPQEAVSGPGIDFGIPPTIQLSRPPK